MKSNLLICIITYIRSKCVKVVKLNLINRFHGNTFRTNNSDDYVVEQSSGLQIDNLSKVSGKELFRDSQYMVNLLHLCNEFCMSLSDCSGFDAKNI